MEHRTENITDRLARCFVTVFPELSPAQARTATVASVATWDSVASLSLIAIVEEEFGVTIDYDSVEQLSSFDAVAAYVSERLAKA